MPGDVAAEGSEGDVAFHVAGSIGLTSLPVTQRSSAPASDHSRFTAKSAGFALFKLPSLRSQQRRVKARGQEVAGDGLMARLLMA